MGFTKTLPIGNMGSLVISESAGVASCKASITESAGGGAIAGFAQASASFEFDLKAQSVIDVGIEMMAVKFPMFSVEILALKGLIDAEIAKA